METRSPGPRVAIACIVSAAMIGLGGCASGEPGGAPADATRQSTGAPDARSASPAGSAKVEPAVTAALRAGEAVRVLISANEDYRSTGGTPANAPIAADSAAADAKRAIVAAGGEGLTLKHDYESLPLILATLTTTAALDAVVASGAATSVEVDGIMHTMGTQG